jgi:hypothetical protein
MPLHCNDEAFTNIEKGNGGMIGDDEWERERVMAAPWDWRNNAASRKD